jgi:hypothetical protein
MRAWWQQFRDRLDALVETYGKIVLVVWFSIYGVTLAIIGALLCYGVPFEKLVDPLLWLGGGKIMAWLGLSVDTAAKAGLLPAVWALSRLTFPLRVVLTGAVTPPIARWWTGRSPPAT